MDSDESATETKFNDGDLVALRCSPFFPLVVLSTYVEEGDDDAMTVTYSCVWFRDDGTIERSDFDECILIEFRATDHLVEHGRRP